MLNNSAQIKSYNNNLIETQKIRIEHLYSIYLDAMKTAFDEGNSYMKYAMIQNNDDLDTALKIRSSHIKNVAVEYEEFNIESLAGFFNMSISEIRKTTNSIVQR